MLEKLNYKGNLNNLSRLEKDEKDNYLERILEGTKKILYYSLIIASPYMPFSLGNLDKDYDTGAKIEHVSPSQLPGTAKGQYNPLTHTMKIANNISGHNEDYVLSHESAHARGIHDEYLADVVASNKSGRNPRELGADSLMFYI
jgi:hypothetical protein